MENTLSPAEQKFFETGELPADLTPAAAEPAPQHHPVHDVQAPKPAEPAPEFSLTPPPPAPESEPTPPPASDGAEYLHRALAEESRRRAEIEAQFSSLKEKLDELTKPKVPEPDPTNDPLGHLNWQLKNMQDQLALLTTKTAETRQQTEQQSRLAAFAENVRNLRNDFAKKTPDFDAAYSHLRNLRAADLAAYGVAPDQIPIEIQRAEFALAESALRSGKNPAAVLYEMATRSGYTPAKPAPKQPSLNEQLDAIRRGLAATPTVPDRAAPPSADPTVDTLRTASERDLNSLVGDDKAWQRILGGGERGLF